MSVVVEGIVQSLFESNWTHTEVAYSNNGYQPQAGVEFIRVGTQPTSSEQKTLGPQIIVRHTGLVFVQVFVPAIAGSMRGYWLVDQARQLLEKRKIDGVWFQVPYESTTGWVEEGWWQLNLWCPYYFDVVVNARWM
jgi:hypothetical protein